MKNWILWSFSRGSFQYDVLCGLILFAIFAIPSGVFNDRPEYMRLPETGDLRISIDDDQNTVYTVKVDVDVKGIGREPMEDALIKLQEYLALEDLPETFRVEEVPNTWGSTVAYAFWIK